ncbi:hypothetical protein BZA05DRAFT_461763 [Tricharina praecox]|uniref:uncharacterized protein n=1 Tax=Tricharina praecox TaxID=43433 RepID=UPI00221F6067|nr:uncharacterized protein BZA05DRAFT_461763 [Tricharina praecox]KAI5843196.1 hypothetical protein BZA05DRAFT_461763 [Tricharina praecox]
MSQPNDHHHQPDERDEIETEEFKVTAVSPAVIGSGPDIKSPHPSPTFPHRSVIRDSPYSLEPANEASQEDPIMDIPFPPSLPAAMDRKSLSHSPFHYNDEEEYVSDPEHQSEDSDWDHLSAADTPPTGLTQDIYTPTDRAIAQTRRLASTAVSTATAAATQLPTLTQPFLAAARKLYTNLTASTAPVDPRDLRAILPAPYPSQRTIRTLEARGLIRAPLYHPALERIFATISVAAMKLYPLWMRRDGGGWLLYFFGSEGERWCGWIVATGNGEQCWCADREGFREWVKGGLGRGRKAPTGRGWKAKVEALGEELEGVDWGEGWVW